MAKPPSIIGPREPVIMAENWNAMVEWYERVLGFKQTYRVEDEYHYCNLETESGVKIGIADAQEMNVTIRQRSSNTVLLQFDVPDVKEFFEHIKTNGGTAVFGPSFDEVGKFWFGGIEDLEGNPIWIVDENC